MSRWLLIAGLAAVGYLAAPVRAEACSCIGGIPLCESLWTTAAVFSGEVVAIAEPPGEPREPFARRRVTFRVLEVWRGAVGASVEVTTGMGGGDCGYRFVTGSRYLVYAHANNAGELSTGICSRTRLLSAASEDIAYLKSVVQTPSAGGRIFGRVMLSRDPSAPPGIADRPIQGYRVTLSNGRAARTTTTRSDGTYEFQGLTADDYTVSLEVPPTEDVRSPAKTKLADPRACARVDFWVVPDGRIRVRLVDADGRPRSNVRIELLNLDAGTPGHPAWQSVYSESNADGWLELSRLHPGRYLLAVNGQRPPRSSVPYPTTYYPGVETRDVASVVVLGRGARVDLGEWILPAQLRERQVAGVVTLSDGAPAVGAHVIVNASKDGGWQWRTVDTSATTGADGRFTLTLLDGVPYELFAFVTRGERRMQIRSPATEVTPGAFMPPLRLVIPGR
ncbi:MAG TPA: carboxypeptidase regulatory-like domain-containing protein [Vicinamibacterales bacterium]